MDTTNNTQEMKRRAKTEYMREYSKRNRQKINKYKLEYRQKNRERLAKTLKDYLKKVAKGSRHDSSWDRINKEHKCCGSRQSNHHKIACHLNNDDLSDLKEL